MAHHTHPMAGEIVGNITYCADCEELIRLEEDGTCGMCDRVYDIDAWNAANPIDDPDIALWNRADRHYDENRDSGLFDTSHRVLA